MNNDIISEIFKNLSKNILIKLISINYFKIIH